MTYFRPGSYALVPNKHLLPQMKGAPLSVYITLCAHADAEGVCFPGIKRLVATTGYDRATVFRALTKLIDLGVIERHHRTTDKGDADSNLYRILLSEEPGGSVENATTPCTARDQGSRTHATTRSRTHATLTNPIELTQLTHRDSGNKKGKLELQAAEPPASPQNGLDPHDPKVTAPIRQRIREQLRMRHTDDSGAGSPLSLPVLADNTLRARRPAAGGLS